jgi:hypothetical protein
LISGAVVPWGLLVLAAGLALFGTGEWAERMSAYTAALGLFILALSFFFARILHWVNEQGK